MQQAFKFIDAYAPIFGDKTYFLLSGGRGSGKSYQIGAFLLMKLVSPQYFRGVVTRYTMSSIKKSIYQDILDIADNYGLSDYITMSGDTISCNHNKNKIVTHSMKISDGNLQAKGKGLSGITHLLIDEAQEIQSEEEYIKLVDSIRTPGTERKIFLLFNPEAKSHWIHKRWFIDGEPNPKWFKDHCFLHTTYKDNPFLDKRKAREWDQLEELEPHRYKYHILGQWKDYVEGRVYSDWLFDYEPDPESEVIYGLDFGFTDPVALVKVNRHKKDLWVKELIHESGMTNGDIIERLQTLEIPKSALIVADTAEPKSIEEIKRAGYNIRGANKSPGSVIEGIKKVQSYRVHCDPTSKNLIEAYQNYAWAKGTDKPAHPYSHLCDSIRYALSLDKLIMTRGKFLGQKREIVTPWGN